MGYSVEKVWKRMEIPSEELIMKRAGKANPDEVACE